jgi:hypothetical protein
VEAVGETSPVPDYQAKMAVQAVEARMAVALLPLPEQGWPVKVTLEALALLPILIQRVVAVEPLRLGVMHLAPLAEPVELVLHQVFREVP